MKKGIILGFLVIIFITYSCDSKVKSDRISERYVGAWKLIGTIPKTPENDHSMDGIICEMEQYNSTDRTFKFHLFSGNLLILSAKSDIYLKGENANIDVRFDEAKQLLYMTVSQKNKYIFEKLK
ncbi:hypothetical protein [Galbibacter pacificus]|uniref:Lipocalin-like domain-containing protein n=1 Tax=Galbibacter pacificus TaxID=2996052 RepID=A0ABT6FRN9_9FLAO|nr:hypothetical protein [Galbibacter pacificus]MDG3582950.1 hypothetical protein [Galbibacter pacificus]MDG3585931.1 hypothetical protein [Galbibacter pacificus]